MYDTPLSYAPWTWNSVVDPLVSVVACVCVAPELCQCGERSNRPTYLILTSLALAFSLLSCTLSNEQLRSIDTSIALSVCPTSPTTALPEKPFKKGLLLIGGFGDPPHVWEGLTKRASKAGWYTMAPRTPGWGRTDFHEANHISWTE